MIINKAKAAIIDRKAPAEAINKLKELNITPILSAEIPNIISEVSTHPDMQIHPIEDDVFVCEPTVYNYYSKILKKYGIIVVKGSTTNQLTYPKDIAYNVARIGDVVIHNSKYTDKTILKHYKNTNKRIIDIKQGYSKCSICPVSENKIITSDRGVGASLAKAGIEVLLIKDGEIKLSTDKNGFFGGTCGFIGKNTIAFCGQLENHPDAEKIKSFLKTNEVDVILLCQSQLQDIGSIIPIY